MNTRTGLIYKATNKINGKSYIGQTVQSLRMRRNDHDKQTRNTKRSKTHFVNALIKYGVDAFEWEILYDSVSVNLLDFAERFAISFYNTLSKNGNGYNIESGGNSKKKLSEETKCKISKALAGRKRPKHVVERVREANKGRSPWNKGKKQSIDHTQKMINSKSQIWEITCPDGKKIFVKNLAKYCRDNGLSQGTLHNTASGRIKQYKGYRARKIEGDRK